jgi:hypothetical protein
MLSFISGGLSEPNKPTEQRCRRSNPTAVAANPKPKVGPNKPEQNSKEVCYLVVVRVEVHAFELAKAGAAERGLDGEAALQTQLAPEHLQYERRPSLSSRFGHRDRLPRIIST